MVVFREDLRGDWIRVAEERVVAFQCQRVLSAIVLWGNRLELLQRNPSIHLCPASVGIGVFLDMSE